MNALLPFPRHPSYRSPGEMAALGEPARDTFHHGRWPQDRLREAMRAVPPAVARPPKGPTTRKACGNCGAPTRSATGVCRDCQHSSACQCAACLIVNDSRARVLSVVRRELADGKERPVRDVLVAVAAAGLNLRPNVVGRLVGDTVTRGQRYDARTGGPVKVWRLA